MPLCLNKLFFPMFPKDVVGQLEQSSGYPWVYRLAPSSIAPIILVPKTCMSSQCKESKAGWTVCQPRDPAIWSLLLWKKESLNLGKKWCLQWLYGNGNHFAGRMEHSYTSRTMLAWSSTTRVKWRDRLLRDLSRRSVLIYGQELHPTPAVSHSSKHRLYKFTVLNEINPKRSNIRLRSMSP